jgi:hypothetical protein
VSTAKQDLEIDEAEYKRRDQALTAIQDAVEIRRRLAAANPADLVRRLRGRRFDTSAPQRIPDLPSGARFIRPRSWFLSVTR